MRVQACGVCRTDLHLAEGDLAPRRPRTVPGHEVVGVVDALGPDAARFAVGDRIGVAWLRGTCGRCRWCRAGRENLCPQATFTGWDADGGYAEYAVVPEAYAYRIPAETSAVEAAPLLCAGIVGYRALRRAELPPGGRLGIYGFGASAHVVAQVAIAQGATVHVLTRSETARALALELGAASAGPADAMPPEPLDAAVLFAPAGELVPVAMRALDAGRDAGRRRDLPLRHPRPAVRRRAVPGEEHPQRHRQHQGGRGGVPAARRGTAGPRHGLAPTAGRGGRGAGRPRRRPDHRRRGAHDVLTAAGQGRRTRRAGPKAAVGAPVGRPRSTWNERGGRDGRDNGPEGRWWPVSTGRNPR